MIIKEPTKVFHKQSGLEYVLTPKPKYGEDAYYMCPNDGRVPSGAMIYRTTEELDKIFTLDWTKHLLSLSQ